MYLEKPIEELMKLIEESGYSTYASWKIQHEMEDCLLYTSPSPRDTR